MSDQAQPIMGDASPQEAPSSQGPVGLGGWLVVVFLSMAGAIIFTSLQLWALTNFVAIWPNLTDSQTSLLIGDAIFNAIIGVVTPIGLLYLFFRKSARFPLLFIAWLVALPIYSVIEASLLEHIMSDFMALGGDAFDQEVIVGILRSMIQAVIGTAYTLSSVRVANTFIN